MWKEQVTKQMKTPINFTHMLQMFWPSELATFAYMWHTFELKRIGLITNSLYFEYFECHISLSKNCSFWNYSKLIRKYNEIIKIIYSYKFSHTRNNSIQPIVHSLQNFSGTYLIKFTTNCIVSFLATTFSST